MPARWIAEPTTVAHLPGLRGRLRTALSDGSHPEGITDDGIEWLLLAVDELTSNGLRHGRVPVRVVVCATGSGWLLDVRDAAPERPPQPALGRDPSTGGLGLHLVAGISVAHGWADHGDHKHVWAQLRYATPSASPAPPSRPAGATTDTTRPG
jgi:hypothetical protein